MVVGTLDEIMTQEEIIEKLYHLPRVQLAWLLSHTPDQLREPKLRVEMPFVETPPDRELMKLLEVIRTWSPNEILDIQCEVYENRP